MQTAEFEEKALQLVTVTETGKYIIHPDGQNFLKRVPKPIAVISVAGMYRTGKSYLLNRILLNRDSGFGVGPTVNPCTKGLWCWGVPYKGTTHDGQKVNIIIIDSQGIGALDEDQNHDTKIFTLAILTSSTFIYNSMGSIDENALQNLSLVVNLTKNIQLKSSKGNNEDEDDPQELADYFPSFYWVVRDFSLQLINGEGEPISSKEYLERALAPQKGFSDDVEEKNRIRRLLSAFFKERDCVTMVRPLVSEAKLQSLEKCSMDDLRIEFIEQANSFRRRVMNNIKPKTIKGENLDGKMYFSLINSYVEAINSGGVPNIENAWTYMCTEKCMKLQENCQNYFGQQIKKELQDNFPCSSQELESILEKVEEACLSIFQNEKVGEESRKYLKQMKIDLQNRKREIRNDNQRASIRILKNYISKQFGVIEKKVKINGYSNFQDFVKDINGFYMNHLEIGPNLPQKQFVYLEFLKKAISNGAQVFLRYTQTNYEKALTTIDEKQKQFKRLADDLSEKLNTSVNQKQQMGRKLNEEIMELQKKCEHQIQEFNLLNMRHIKDTERTQHQFSTKLQELNAKIKELTHEKQKLTSKYEKTDNEYSQHRKQTEKNVAILELKQKQSKQELDSLKIKEKNNQIALNELKYKHNIELKQILSNNQKATQALQIQIFNLKEKMSEIQEEKSKLSLKFDDLQKLYRSDSKKYMQELKSKSEQIVKNKIEHENQKKTETQKLKIQFQEQAALLQQEKVKQNRLQRDLKQLSEKTKSITSQYQKQTAVLSQRVQFLLQELEEYKEVSSEKITSYENKIRAMEEIHIKEQAQQQFQKIKTVKDQLQNKIRSLQVEFDNSRAKLNQEIQQLRKQKEEVKFNSNLQKTSLLGELNNFKAFSEKLEKEVQMSYSEKKSIQMKLSEEFRAKEVSYLNKIKTLESQIENIMDKASEQQSSNNSKSEELIKHLKNYYDLEREQSQKKLMMEKEKYQRKLAQLKEDYEHRLQEEIKSLQEDIEMMKEEQQNEGTMLQNIISQLQHQNDIKTKSLENLQTKFTEQKLKSQKMAQQFNLKYDKVIENQSIQKENLYKKITEMQNHKSKVEKELISANHQKDQFAKDLLQKQTLLKSKTSESESLLKNIETMSVEYRNKLNEITNDFMDKKINYEKKIALSEQQNEHLLNKIKENQRQVSMITHQYDEKIQKFRDDLGEDIKSREERKNEEILALEAKCEKLKKSMKDNESEMMKTIHSLEKELAIEREKSSHLEVRMKDFEQRKLVQNQNLAAELQGLKVQSNKLKLDSAHEVNSLKNQLAQLQNDKNQVTVLYEREKVLWENKNTFLEESKQKNKRQHHEAIKKLELAIQALQKSRLADKTMYENMNNENVAKIQKRYWANLQEANENFSKKENEYESAIKKMNAQIRNLSQKLAIEIQMRQDTTSSNERRIKELQENEKRALSELQKLKGNKDLYNNESMESFEKEKTALRAKIQQKEEKYKKIQTEKQILYFQFEKEKAKWIYEKESFASKYDDLKDTIAKNEKDIQKLQRENEKLKVEKKCNKMSTMQNYSRYTGQIKSSNRSSFQDSQSTINLSMTLNKQNNPLGDHLSSFWNSQQ